jgi:two-component system cell cycle sensor histidine kinase/response regulator CckA
LTGHPPEDLLENHVVAYGRLIHPEDQAKVQRDTQAALQQGHPFELEYRLVARDGQVKWVWEKGQGITAEGGQLIALEGFISDITEKKRLEAQFLRAQRMESIGTLASGIAHDLNNILAPIIMAADVLQQNPKDKFERDMLATIDLAAKRGADIVKQVLTFARGIGGQRALLQPRHLIKEIVKIAEETFPRDIGVRSNVARNLWTVTGDATQLHQVLLNLAVNARDAMPNGGTLWVTAENIIIDESQAVPSPEAKPGPHVVFQVQDTGTGIPAENLEKIFDPFFTTKPQGKGTGLGLSTVMGIIKSHGGFIQVWSEPDKGSLFKVYLPATGATITKRAEVEASPLPCGHGELILVVDDEAAVRNVTLNTLRRHGYEVLVASHGKEAVALFAQHLGRVQLVLTDIMMPVMDGYALAKALRELAPDVRIIASSGLVQDDDMALLAAREFAQFLNKPYTAEELLTVIAGVFKPAS